MDYPMADNTPSASLTQVETPIEYARMKGALLKDIRRSAYVYRVDCGGCNGCEIEIFAAITPLFDAERFGIKVVASPRHADILLYTGAMTRAMRAPALRAYEAAPDPKIVVSYGACGCSGGIFHDLYCVWGGTDKAVPVDVYIPGCPPTPAATIYGFAVALGLLGQKLKATTHIEADGEAAPISHPDIPYNLRVILEREARRMAGYRQGRDIAEQFLSLLDTPANSPVTERIARFLQQESDPRKAEIFARLQSIFTEAVSGGLR
ncbi:MAG: NADH-quinone oxidoreductase subunit B family protein [Acetobacteraceae bacterium]|nr:NADH-quinone oxidoreductase subunit B family protein [Acetobacteraceae bacterium]